MKVKLNVEGRKSVSTSKLVISKQSSKSIIKDKVFAVFSIEMNSDNEKKKNKEKNAKNDKKKKNVENINAFLIVKKLFDQKNRNIIDFKKRVNDVKKNHINVSSTQNFKKNEIISSASKKIVTEIFTLITKTYILAWMTFFNDAQFD